jgi:hypothetical protein
VIKDEQWPVARLIPISSASGVEAQERRAASALLAVMATVDEFGRALLKPLGAPAGRIETFIEIPFKIEGRPIRPDGIITVSRGGRTWGAIVETKTGTGLLTPDQMNIYLDLARELEFDAVLSISNQYVTSSTEYPIEVDKRKLRKVSLHHWSWVDVLTEAVVQKEYRGVSDPDQAYILGELIRYLSDPRSGAVSFDGMGPSWTAIRDGARGQTLRKGDADVSVVAARWDDLVRYLALGLTKDLGRDVRQVLDSSERSPITRRQALTDSLVNSGRLYAELQVPNVAGPLTLEADLRARQVTVSTRIDAPAEGRSKGRVSWLLRQLQNAPENLTVEARVARSSSSLASSLGLARQTPEALYPEGGKDIRQFVLSLSLNMGLKRDSGRGSFVESVVGATESFYAEVLQNLRAWKAAPPKLKKAPEVEAQLSETAKELLTAAAETGSTEAEAAATEAMASAQETAVPDEGNSEASSDG